MMSEKKLLNSFIISSDGWLVTYVSDYTSGMEKNWEAIDYQGTSYKIEKVLYDKLEKMLYLKITASGLRVVSFPVWQDLNVDTELWAINNNWEATFIKKENILENNFAWSIWQPQNSWQLTDSFIPGTIFFNNQGQFVGVAVKDNLLSHGWLVEKQINELLVSGKLQYLGVPWQGYFVRAANKIEGSNISGFYIEKVGSVNSSIAKGDIVLKINGENTTAKNLAYLLWTAPNDLEVIVWRQGSELTVKVTKMLLTF